MPITLSSPSIIYLSMDLSIVLHLFEAGTITMLPNSLIQQYNVKKLACHITMKDSSSSMVGWGARAACAEVSTGSVEASKAKHGQKVCTEGYYLIRYNNDINTCRVASSICDARLWDVWVEWMECSCQGMLMVSARSSGCINHRAQPRLTCSWPASGSRHPWQLLQRLPSEVQCC
jgi:hypothetical protein